MKVDDRQFSNRIFQYTDTSYFQASNTVFLLRLRFITFQGLTSLRGLEWLNPAT